MSAISPPPMGADAEEKVVSDNRKALVALRASTVPQRGSLAWIVGGAVALGLISVAFATLGASMFRARPRHRAYRAYRAYRRFV